ncbi:hypothetical protein R3P38DRAFT_3346727 [Favolaschia claudopus]|uniref:Uncharacterized protein n=1 Tax=Favolaschia claudopus TaxID=2862362 RepID=A0AAW0CXZ3_9AGAR
MMWVDAKDEYGDSSGEGGHGHGQGIKGTEGEGEIDEAYEVFGVFFPEGRGYGGGRWRDGRRRWEGVGRRRCSGHPRCVDQRRGRVWKVGSGTTTLLLYSSYIFDDVLQACCRRAAARPEIIAFWSAFCGARNNRLRLCFQKVSILRSESNAAVSIDAQTAFHTVSNSGLRGGLTGLSVNSGLCIVTQVKAAFCYSVIEHLI